MGGGGGGQGGRGSPVPSPHFPPCAFGLAGRCSAGALREEKDTRARFYLISHLLMSHLSAAQSVGLFVRPGLITSHPLSGGQRGPLDAYDGKTIQGK